MKKPLLTLWCVSRADLRMLCFALMHPERPRWLRPATVLLVPYAIAPVNFVISVLGIVEDLVLAPRLGGSRGPPSTFRQASPPPRPCR